MLIHKVQDMTVVLCKYIIYNINIYFERDVIMRELETLNMVKIMINCY